MIGAGSRLLVLSIEPDICCVIDAFCFEKFAIFFLWTPGCSWFYAFKYYLFIIHFLQLCLFFSLNLMFPGPLIHFF